MTLEYHFVNFYDSGFENPNESNIFDGAQDLLNEAFVASPVYDDTSWTDLANSGNLGKAEKTYVSTAKRKLMPRYGDLDSEIGDIQSEISEATDVSKKDEVKPVCIFTSTYWEDFQKSPKGWTKFEKKSNGIEGSEKTEQSTNLSKKNEEKAECIFTSTCLSELPKLTKEYDWNKFEENSNRDDGSEKIEPKITVPISRFDYVPHELSTILEVDSLLMDESAEPLMNSDKYNSLIMHDSKNHKTKDSFKSFNKSKVSTNVSANVMKVIQNNHIEKFLQEPGILEESDLTLITSDFDLTSEFTKKSKDTGYYHSYYKSKRFSDGESPSLKSFLQHELSCMKDCVDE